MTRERANPWTILRTRTVYSNAWLDLIEHDVITPRGGAGLYGVMSPKKIALGVVPFLSDGRVVLVGQFRFPLGRYSWEIPEGGGDKDADPRVSIARELREETGYTANGWSELIRLDLSNSLTDEQAIAFLAWDLMPGPADPDETEALDVTAVPFRDVLARVLSGEITDAISVAALLKVAYLAQARALPAPIQSLVVV